MLKTAIGDGGFGKRKDGAGDGCVRRALGQTRGLVENVQNVPVIRRRHNDKRKPASGAGLLSDLGGTVIPA